MLFNIYKMCDKKTENKSALLNEKRALDCRVLWIIAPIITRKSTHNF